MSERKSVRATLIELWSRVIKIDTTKDGSVYWNGENNHYPNEIERVIINSPSASRSSKMFGKYISGKGLLDEASDVTVNVKKNYKLSGVAALAGQTLAKQGGAFFHIGYGFDDASGELIIVQKSLDVLDYSKCRLAKEDDENNAGKIFYKDYCEQKSFGGKKTKTKWYYPYNPNEKVLIEQIKADYATAKGKPTEDLSEMIKHFRGQVYYLNLTPEYKYALSPFDSVFNDCDSEYRISTYINSEWRNGLLGKTAVLTAGLDAEIADQIKEDLLNWLGSEKSSGIYHMDIEKADDLDKILKVIQVKGQFDEKMFEKTNIHLRNNILGAANNIPEALVLSSSGALFGTSADAYTEMKLFYSEQTEDERWKLSETLTYLGFPCEIKPIVETNAIQTPSV